MTDFEIESRTAGPFGTNTYLVIDPASKRCAAIDAGYEAERLWPPVIRERGLKLESIILTHGHIDHVAGVAALAREFPDAAILIHPEDAGLLQGGASAAATFFGLPPIEPAEPTGSLEEGRAARVGGVEFEVLFVPGHCPGHVALLRDGHLIAGDVLFAGSIGRTDLPGGDYRTLADSIVTKLMPLDDAVRVYPGHGPETTIGAERRSNPFVLQMLAERRG